VDTPVLSGGGEEEGIRPGIARSAERSLASDATRSVGSEADPSSYLNTFSPASQRTSRSRGRLDSSPEQRVLGQLSPSPARRSAMRSPGQRLTMDEPALGPHNDLTRTSPASSPSKSPSIARGGGSRERSPLVRFSEKDRGTDDAPHAPPPAAPASAAGDVDGLLSDVRAWRQGLSSLLSDIDAHTPGKAAGNASVAPGDGGALQPSPAPRSPAQRGISLGPAADVAPAPALPVGQGRTARAGGAEGARRAGDGPETPPARPVAKSPMVRRSAGQSAADGGGALALREGLGGVALDVMVGDGDDDEEKRAAKVRLPVGISLGVFFYPHERNPLPRVGTADTL